MRRFALAASLLLSLGLGTFATRAALWTDLWFARDEPGWHVDVVGSRPMQVRNAVERETLAPAPVTGAKSGMIYLPFARKPSPRSGQRDPEARPARA